MKCGFLVVAFLSFFSIGSFAQVAPVQVTLTGIIVVSATLDTVPYKLVLSDKNGEVSGYSLTYKVPYETKTKIQGVLDRRAHTLSFKETEIEYSRGYHSGVSMCLVDALLEEKHSANGTVLKGHITSTETDNTSCGGGKVYFTNELEIQNLFSYHEKYDTVISMKRKVKETATAAVATTPAPADVPLVADKITAGEEKAFDWHSDTVVIEAWDGGTVDGDRITIQFNGKTRLENYSLVKEKKQLRIPLAGHGVNTISIIADNEGTEPPNTASLLFIDGTTKYSVIAYNKKGQQAVIKIKRVN